MRLPLTVFQRPSARVHRSLRSTLTVTLLVVTCLVGVAHTGAVYLLARHRASIAMDAHVEDVARHFLVHGPNLLSPSHLQIFRLQGDMLVEAWLEGNASSRPDHTTDAEVFIPRIAPGLRDVFAGGQAWRVYAQTGSGLYVLTALPLRTVRRSATASALDSFVPTVVLVALLWLTVHYCLRRAMTPLDQLGARMLARQDSGPLPFDDYTLPAEVMPFVHSINTLVARLAKSIDAEREFVAQAAHQLRTPISALMIQAHNVQHARGETERATRLSELAQSVQRTGALVSQLLGLARAEGVPYPKTLPPIDLIAIIREVVAGYLPIVTARNIDLGYDTAETQLEIACNRSELTIALTNLIDNAVRYCPDGARIDLRSFASEGRVFIEILDDGPGIPPDMLDRVFERFVRVPGGDVDGSGLGLAIVRAIVNKHGGRVSISNRVLPLSGTIVTIELPQRS